MQFVQSMTTSSRMMRRVLCCATAVCACVAGVNYAQADTVFKLAGSDAPVGASLANSLRVGLDVADVGDAFQFTFTNTSNRASSITKIWFEQGLFARPLEDVLRPTQLSVGGPLLVPPTDHQNIGDVNLVDKSNAPLLANVPKLLGQEDWEGTSIAFLAKYLTLKAGINAETTDAFSVTFDKSPAGSELTSDDIVSLLTTPGTRIGVLFAGIPNANRAALISFAPAQQPSPVPTPAAFAAGALLLMGLGATRRRRSS